MSFTIRELPKAKQDKESIFSWLSERSPSGAIAWLDAYDAAMELLQQRADSFGKAPESDKCNWDVRQILFKTRHGRVYRALFFIEGHVAYVLRVRGPGQAPVSPRELR